jgi:Transposase DDE domain
VSGDSGFATEANLAAMSERRIAADLAPGRARHGQSDPGAVRTLKRRPLMQAMADKLRRAGRRSRYRLRKQVVEPVFGQIKQARGFRQFLLRGREGVRAEWALICTAHNLLKLVAARTACARAHPNLPHPAMPITTAHLAPSPAPSRAPITRTGS